MVRDVPIECGMRSLVPRVAIIAALFVLQLGAQPGRGPGPPAPPHDPKAVQRRIAEVRSHLTADQPATPEQRELATFARTYLDHASSELAAGHPFQAERFADAADACRRPIEHVQRAADAAPPSPPPPDDRLQQVYFRLRLSAFFLQQIPSPQPSRLLELARAFYEQAVKAKEHGSMRRSEEYAAAADDLTHALESLAQASVAETVKP